MYVVIFTANIEELDQHYISLADTLRQRAIEIYGCTEFISTSQSKREVALSYWPSLESIKRWKADELHLEAQELGKLSWYRGYRVQVCEVLHSYSD